MSKQPEQKRVLIVNSGGMADIATEVSYLKSSGYEVVIAGKNGGFSVDDAIDRLVGVEASQFEEARKRENFNIILSRMFMSNGSKLEQARQATGVKFAEHLKDKKVLGDTPILFYDEADTILKHTNYDTDKGVISLGNDIEIPAVFVGTVRKNGVDYLVDIVGDAIEHHKMEKLKQGRELELEPKKQVLFVVAGPDKNHILEKYNFDDTEYDVHFAGKSDVCTVDDAIDILVNKNRKFDLVVSNMAMSHADGSNFTLCYTSNGYSAGLAFAVYLQDKNMLDTPFIFYDAPSFLSECSYYNAEKGVVNFENRFEIPVALQGEAERETTLIDHMDKALEVGQKKKVLFVVCGGEQKHLDAKKVFEDDGYEVCFADANYPVDDAIRRVVSGEKYDVVISAMAMKHSLYLSQDANSNEEHTGYAFAEHMHKYSKEMPVIIYSDDKFLQNCVHYNEKKQAIRLNNGTEIPTVLTGQLYELVEQVDMLLLDDEGYWEDIGLEFSNTLTFSL